MVQTRSPTRARVSTRTVGAALAVVMLGGCGAVAGSGPARQPVEGPRATTVAPTPVERVDFRLAVLGENGQDPDLANRGSRRVQVSVVTESEGRLVGVPGPSATAGLRFPRYSESDPELAVVAVVPIGRWMNPLRRDFRLGVDVRLDRESSGTKRDNGDNVLQRGLFTDPAQFKVQVDSHRPSCVVRGSAGRVIARSRQLLRPSIWYRITCERAGDTVTMRVRRLTGGPAGAATLSRESGPIGVLAFAHSTPLTIGAKIAPDGAPAAATDQFNGSLASVVLDID